MVSHDGKPEQEKNGNSDRKEDVRIGYQVAANLWIQQCTMTWNRFSVMLLSHSIILGAIVLLLTRGSWLSLAVILTVVGFYLCILWFVIMKRAFCYEKYLVLSARELELNLDLVDTLKQGGDFMDGEEVTRRLGKNWQTKKLRMSDWGRLLKGNSAFEAVMLLVALLYFSILLMIVFSHYLTIYVWGVLIIFLLFPVSMFAAMIITRRTVKFACESPPSDR